MPHHPPDYDDDDRKIVYIERPANGERTLLGWILGVAGTLLVVSITAAWSGNARLAALETNIENLRREFAEFKSYMDPRFAPSRGVEPRSQGSPRGSS